MTIRISPDEDLENADWLRGQRWPEKWAHISSADEFREMVRRDPFMTLTAFKTTPLYKRAKARGEPKWIKDL